MSAAERGKRPAVHTVITGHTGPDGGALDARTEPAMHPDEGTPGQYEGPMDGRLSGYGQERLSDQMLRAEPVAQPAAQPAAAAPGASARRASRTRATPATDGDGRIRDARSVVQLLRELSTESGDLVRQEVELAKAELRQKLGVYQRGLLSMAVGGACLLAALLLGLWAADSGLTAILTRFLEPGVAVWLSPLILAATLALVGWGMIAGARQRLASEGLMPRRTARTLRDDRHWAAAKVREMKEEMSHVR